MVLTVTAAPAFAQRAVDNMRGPTPLEQTAKPAPMANPDNSDVRRVRNYAMQPPVIPHKIEGYQVDTHANRCMMCHARTRTQQSQAPAVSVSHYMDRDGNFLAELSPRRYFCLQCHVPQANLEPLVGNKFKDVDTMLNQAPPPAAAPARK
jgi:cytochrome c-type protein NapB